MQIIDIRSKKDWKLFHQVPHLIYKDDPKWICPLEKDINEILSPETNKIFSHADGKCFVLLDEQNRPVGRIAAFLDHQLKEKLGYTAGGVGFFECINRAEYAYALFDAAAEYLNQFEVQVIDGPINLGERDKFWGLLVKGFDPPLYQENYHPTYYRKFFEDWGFEPYEQILTMKAHIKEVPIQRFRAIAERARNRYPFRTELMKLKNMEKYAHDFASVYNASFQHSPYFQPIEKEQAVKAFRDARPIADPNLLSFTYHEDRPIGFCILLPDINPFFKFLKGRMNILKGLQFLYKLRVAKCKDIKGIAFGIHPDYHKKGVFSLLVQRIYDHPDFMDKYAYFSLATIRSYNEIMVKSTSNLGVKIDRMHYTYRKILDKNLSYEKYKFLPEE